MAESIQSVRGVHDILPVDCENWWQLEQLLRKIAKQYGYQEIKLPILEFAKLFVRGIGNSTDIVEKEMYTFTDRSGEELALRPEGTASCLRASIEHDLIGRNKKQRLFYYGPMFRHEKPQQGRYRQFYQFGVEAYGMSGIEIEAELLMINLQLWRELGIASQVELQLNDLGTLEARGNYRTALVDYFNRYHNQLDEDSKRRLSTNPLRILDTKDKVTREIVKGAPRLVDYLDEQSLNHFESLSKVLDELGINFRVNYQLVRGLDYYSGVVFEWVIKDSEKSQNTLCAGGRYDKLVELVGGSPSPAIGFAIGIERLISLVGRVSKASRKPLLALVVLEDDLLAYGLKIAFKIRSNTNLTVLMTSSGSLKSQLSKAVTNKATIALIVGAQEYADKMITVKYLDDDKPQEQINSDNLVIFCNTIENLI